MNESPPVNGLFSPLPGGDMPSREFLAPQNPDGSINFDAPECQWVEVERRRTTIIRHSTPPEDRDPIVAEVKLHRLRRDLYGDGFLVDKILYAHPNRRPPPPRYDFRSTRQRFERDAKRIQQRKEAVKRKNEAIRAEIVERDLITPSLNHNGSQYLQRAERTRPSAESRVSKVSKLRASNRKPQNAGEGKRRSLRKSSRQAEPVVPSASGVRKTKPRAKR